MTTFVLDLWHDLRAKRLWPVAVLLVVGIVAIPLLMLKGGDSGASGAPVAPGPAASAAGIPTVGLSTEGRAGGSDLDRFDPKDPFKSTEPKAAEGVGGGASGGSSGSPSDPSPGFGTSSTGGSTGSGSTGGSTGGASTGGGSTGGGSTGSPSDPSSGLGKDKSKSTDPAPQRRTTSYKYTIDVEFGRRDKKLPRRTSVDQLQPLPDSTRPIVIFLGVTADGSRAVFGLAPQLTQAGEGSCRPSRKRCTFLSLRTDASHNGHYLRGPNGERFMIRVRAINRERVRKAAPSSGAALPPLVAGVER